MTAPRYIREGNYLCGIRPDGWAVEIPLDRVGEVVLAADHDKALVEEWDAAVNHVAQAIEGVERLDFAQYPTGSVALVEVDRIRDAIAELYRGDRP